MTGSVDSAVLAEFGDWAEGVDRGDAGAASIVARLKKSGLLELPVVTSESPGRLTRIAERLEAMGHRCVSSALGLTMHYVSLLYMIDYLPPLDASERTQLDEVVARAQSLPDGGAFIANCYAEPGSGSHVLGVQTTASRCAGGWVLNGKKYGSFANVADFLQVHADWAGKIVQFLVPASLQGLRFGPQVGTIGTRGAAPMVVSLEDVIVEDHWRFGPPDMFRAAADAFPFATLLNVAPYLGAARAAMDHALDHARSRCVGPERKPLAEMPFFRLAMAESFVQFASVRALLYRCCDGGNDMSATRAMEIHAAKVAVATAAADIAQDMMRLCGLRGLVDDLPLGRFLRDAQAAAHHPPSLAESYQQIGDRVCQLTNELH